MFKYNRELDRFVPDRRPDPYSFCAIRSSLSHQCVGASEHSSFLEPFECERLKEQQHRAFRQLQSYMSLESNGGHLLRYVGALQDGDGGHRRLLFASHCSPVDYNVTWPMRVVRERRSARKTYCANKKLSADLLLDMPNLSNDWMTKILDWSSTGYLTAAIESSVHLWSSRTQSVQYTINATAESDDSVKTIITCLKWDSQGEKLAYAFTIDQDASVVSYNSADDTMTVDTGSRDSDMSARTTGTVPAELLTTVRLGDAENDTNAPNPLNLNNSTTSETMMMTSNDPVKKSNYIKVWLLNKQKDSSNYEKKSATCGCETIHSYVNLNECCVIVMDWLENCRVLVTGCTRATITFFRYDYQEERLIAIRVIARCHFNIPTLISCLHLSQDKFSRHLAFATYSPRACTLKVWRIEDPPEYPRCRRDYLVDSNTIQVTETLTDVYNNKIGVPKRIIKAFAWHPWKHSLMCYAVVSIAQEPLLASPPDGGRCPSWYVLANACKGQVLRRVEQSACNSCPTVRILSVNTHAMTFSRITGELLVSATTVYNVRKRSNADGTGCISIMKKHSIVVMHALDRIVETLSSSETDKGLFFAWSPDGTRIALTSTEESLRIWNFWPTTVVCVKSDRKPEIGNPVAGRPAESGYQPVNGGGGGGETSKHDNDNYHYYYRSDNNTTTVSELSLDASRVIK